MTLFPQSTVFEMHHIHRIRYPRITFEPAAPAPKTQMGSSHSIDGLSLSFNDANGGALVDNEPVPNNRERGNYSSATATATAAGSVTGDTVEAAPPKLQAYITDFSNANSIVSQDANDAVAAGAGTDSNPPNEQVLEDDKNFVSIPQRVSSDDSEGGRRPRMLDQVESIQHHAPTRSIHIHLKPNRTTCLNPRFMGRLSGPHLVLIEWSEPERREGGFKVSNTTTTTNEMTLTNRIVRNTVVGTYPPLPVVSSSNNNTTTAATNYFVEIIGIFSEDFDLDVERVSDHCVEDPLHHRITANGATITVAMEDNNNILNNKTLAPTTRTSFGIWTHNATNSQQQQQQERFQDPSFQPVYTRFQPQGCRKKYTTYCTERSSLDRFHPYEWQWTSYKKQQMTMPTYPLNHSMTICFVGYSHANGLQRTVGRWARIWKWPVKPAWLPTRRSIDLITSFNRSVVHEHSCTMVLMAVGQWAAAFKTPMNFREWRRDMNEAIRHYQSVVGHVNNLHLRSIHYNPLGDWITTCPPRDGRNPRVLEIYNVILEELAHNYSLKYWDTNFVMGPMWDHSHDWCHPQQQETDIEATYFLYELVHYHHRQQLQQHYELDGGPITSEK